MKTYFSKSIIVLLLFSIQVLLPGCSHSLKADYDFYARSPIIERSPATIGITVDGNGQKYEDLLSETSEPFPPSTNLKLILG